MVDFLQSKGIPIEQSSISACHTLPTRDTSRIKPIVVRFTNRKAKIAVLMNRQNLKETEKSPKERVYVNEHLTTKNSNIAKQGRNLRKRGKIEGTWTKNCKVFVKVVVDNVPRIMQIRREEDLLQFEQ